MNAPITPWINLMLHQAQRHHLALFIYGWMEREQVLNLEAFVEWWVGGDVAQHMFDAHCDQAVMITDGGMVTGQVHPSQWNALDRPFANAGRWPVAGAPVDEIDATFLTFKAIADRPVWGERFRERIVAYQSAASRSHGWLCLTAAANSTRPNMCQLRRKSPHKRRP